MPATYHRILGASVIAATLVAAGCDRGSQGKSSQAPEADAREGAGLQVAHRPCRVEIDSPADGEVDAVVEVTYDDQGPRRAYPDYGEGSEMNACVSFGYADGELVSKTVHQRDCDDKAADPETSTVRSVDGSNLVVMTFPDGELTYHYAAAPGDFTFLLTRTSYNLGPQKIENVQIRDGRFQSLELPTPEATHTVEADYRAGKLIRVSEKDPDGDEVGYASFHYRDDRLHKVKRRLATMSKDQSEEVRLVYECDGGTTK